MNYLFDPVELETEYNKKLRIPRDDGQSPMSLLEQGLFQPYTDQQLWEEFRKQSQYKRQPWESKLSDVLSPFVPGVQMGTGQARVSHEKDDQTAEGLDQIFKMGRETVGLGASTVAKRVSALGGGIGGAIAGGLSDTGTWDQGFTEWYDKTYAKAQEFEQVLRGTDPSFAMQVLDKKVFQPAIDELAEQTGNRALAEKHGGMLMDLMMLKGAVKPRATGTSVISPSGVETPIMSKTPSLINKGILGTGAVVAAPLVAPYLAQYGDKSPFDDTVKQQISGLSDEQLALVAAHLVGAGQYSNSGKFIPAKHINSMEGVFTHLDSKVPMKYEPAINAPVLSENWRSASTVTELFKDAGKLPVGVEQLFNNAKVYFDVGKEFDGYYSIKENELHLPKDKNLTSEDVLRTLPHEFTHTNAGKYGFPQGASPSQVDLHKVLGAKYDPRLDLSTSRKGKDIKLDIYRDLEGERLAEASELDTMVQTGKITPEEYLAEVQRNPMQQWLPEGLPPLTDVPQRPIRSLENTIYTEPQQAYNSNIKSQEGRYVTQDDGVRPNGDVLNAVADSTQQTTVQGPSAINNRTLQVNEPKAAQEWSRVGGKQVQPVSINTVDMRNPKPGVVLVHSSQVDGLDVWDPSKANPEYYTGKNTSGGFWGAPKEGAELHGADRPENVTGQYLIRAENPISIKYDGGPKTQAAMQAARAAGHDVAFLYDDQGSRNVVHLKPEEGGVKNLKNTGEWSESPSMLHSWALPVAAATAALLLGDDDQQKALGLAGTMAVIPKSQRINEINAKIRAAATTAEKAALGKELKAVMQEGKQATASVEKPLIDPYGATFQLKSANALSQLPENMKLTGPDLAKHLQKRGISKDEISSVFGDLNKVGPTTARDWVTFAERQAPKINVDVYGGPEPDTSVIRQELTDIIAANDNLGYDRASGARAELLTGHLDPDTVVWDTPEQAARANEIITQLRAPKTYKSPIYQSWFKDDIAKLGSRPETYQVTRLGAGLPDTSLNQNAQKQFGKNFDQLSDTELKQLNTDTPKWKETEHAEVTTENSLGGPITTTMNLPSVGEVTVLHEWQSPKIVKEQAASVEQTAKKMAKENDLDYPNTDWIDLPQENKQFWLEEAKKKKAKNPVPEPLAERSIELIGKKLVADAVEAGHAGILLQTGPEIAKRWNLTNWFDEARYNPETQMLTMYKDGLVKVEPHKVPPEKLGEQLNSQELADRLLASPIGGETKIATEPSASAAINVREAWYSTHPETEYEIRQNKDTTEWEVFAKGGNSHTLTDLSIDKPWTTVEYGRWEGDKYIPGKVANTLKRLTGGEIELVDVGGQKQPFLRFPKDTPKTFSLYEWAAMTGLSAAIIKQFMDETDENKQKMLSKFPALGMIGAVATKGKNPVKYTPEQLISIGKEIGRRYYEDKLGEQFVFGDNSVSRLSPEDMGGVIPSDWSYVFKPSTGKILEKDGEPINFRTMADIDGNIYIGNAEGSGITVIDKKYKDWKPKKVEIPKIVPWKIDENGDIEFQVRHAKKHWDEATIRKDKNQYEVSATIDDIYYRERFESIEEAKRFIEDRYEVSNFNKKVK